MDSSPCQLVPLLWLDSHQQIGDKINLLTKISTVYSYKNNLCSGLRIKFLMSPCNDDDDDALGCSWLQTTGTPSQKSKGIYFLIQEEISKYFGSKVVRLMDPILSSYSPVLIALMAAKWLHLFPSLYTHILVPEVYTCTGMYTYTQIWYYLLLLFFET